jgi:hypothetical protein
LLVRRGAVEVLTLVVAQSWPQALIVEKNQAGG